MGGYDSQCLLKVLSRYVGLILLGVLYSCKIVADEYRQRHDCKAAGLCEDRTCERQAKRHGHNAN